MKKNKGFRLKTLFLLSFLLFSILNIHSQNYLNSFKSDICQCLQDKELSARMIDNQYDKCFSKHLVSYAQLIDNDIQEEDITKKYLEGQKVRRDIRFKFRHELMYSCNAYFYAVERGVFNQKQLAKKRGDSTQLQKYHELVAMSPNWSSYLYRAGEYYKLNDLKHAEQDVLKSMELSPYKDNDLGERGEKFLLAQIYEDQKRYSEAIKLYDQIVLGDIDYKTNMLKAIVVRKNQGKYKLPNSDVREVVDKTKTNTNISKQKNGSEKLSKKNTSEQTRRRSRARTAVKISNDSIKVKKAKPATRKDSTKSIRSLFKLN